MGNFQYNFAWKMSKRQKLGISTNALFNVSKNTLAGASFQEYFIRINYGFTI